MTHCINVTSDFLASDLSCYTQPSVANLMSNFVNQVVEELSKVEGLSKILVAEHEAYKGLLPGNQKKILIVTQGFTVYLYYSAIWKKHLQKSKRMDWFLFLHVC